MTEHNINESTINENPEDKQASDAAAAAAHAPTEDMARDEGMTPEKIGEAARKVATETAYAAAGIAGFVGEKARSFYDEQKKQYTTAHPDEDGPSAKAFLDQLSEQLNRFADELSRGFKDLAEKGRDVTQRGSQSKRTEGEGSVNDGDTAATENAPTFSGNHSEDVIEGTSQSDSVLGDAEKRDDVS